MRKSWLIGLVSVVVGILLAAPVVMGFVIQRIYDEAIEAANQQAAEGFLVIGEFNRGFWTSTGTTRIEELGKASTSAIVLRHDWVHGPVPLGEMFRGRSPMGWLLALLDTTYSPDPAVFPQLSLGLSSDALVEVLARLHFDRSLAVTFRIKGVDTPGSAFSSEGLWGEANLGGQDAKFFGRVTLGRTVLGEDESLVLAGATFSARQIPLAEGLGTFELLFDLGEVEFMGGRFGPGEVSASVKRVDLAAMAEFNARLSEVEAQASSEDQRMSARATLMASELPRVLRGFPEIEISGFELASSRGRVTGRAHIGLDDSDPTLLANPLFLMGLIQAQAELAVSEEMLEYVLDRYMVLSVAASEEAQGLSEADLLEMAGFMREGMLESLMAQKRLVRDEGEYGLEVGFDGGLLILNGEMLDPEELSDLFPTP